jgi:hypothetical protein
VCYLRRYNNVYKSQVSKETWLASHLIYHSMFKWALGCFTQIESLLQESECFKLLHRKPQTNFLLVWVRPARLPSFRKLGHRLMDFLANPVRCLYARVLVVLFHPYILRTIIWLYCEQQKWLVGFDIWVCVDLEFLRGFVLKWPKYLALLSIPLLLEPRSQRSVIRVRVLIAGFCRNRRFNRQIKLVAKVLFPAHGVWTGYEGILVRRRTCLGIAFVLVQVWGYRCFTIRWA